MFSLPVSCSKGDNSNYFLGISSADQQPDVYEDRFNTIVENGFVALGISLGHKVGLFKALIELSEPETSLTIAQHANLHERYKVLHIQQV